MRRFLTENRVLAFIQIVLAVGGGAIVIAVVDSLSSLPWLYLAAIFCFVAAGCAALLFRFFGSTVAPESPSLPPLPPVWKEPSLYEELAQARKRGKSILEEIRWRKTGRSLRFFKWKVGITSLLSSRAPEYYQEADALITKREPEDEELAVKEWLDFLGRVMKERRDG